KALPEFQRPEDMEVLVLGDPDLFAKLAGDLGLPPLENVHPVGGKSPALAALEEAALLAKSGVADAVVTAPVNKARLKVLGFPYPGQTEFFASRLGVSEYAMMLTDGSLRVVPATIHLALRDVPGALDRHRIAATVGVLHRALRTDFGIESPRIAVLGLNPHAGEGGHFGDEEERIIAPAMMLLVREGIAVEGPLPSDAAFTQRVRERYDALVGMYHDQTLGPFKALADGRGVNVTLGLPIVRTSPDHGTAEDIAGRGVADPSSFLRALETAATLAENRLRA
ncbi:MAG: 4-hydroxythreonine-4-phosphate dehydrogenase PdxA, partial [Planctomycetota bacterium]